MQEITISKSMMGGSYVITTNSQNKISKKLNWLFGWRICIRELINNSEEDTKKYLLKCMENPTITLVHFPTINDTTIQYWKIEGTDFRIYHKNKHIFDIIQKNKKRIEKIKMINT